MRLSTTGKNIRQAAAAAGAATNRFQAPDYRLQTAQVPRTGRSWTQQRAAGATARRWRCYFRYCVVTMCAIIICPSQKVCAGRVLGVGCSRAAGGRYDVFVSWLGSGAATSPSPVF